MDVFSTSQLRHLMREQAGPCVSVYLSTHAAGGAGQQDPVRLKNLLQRAEERLIADGMRPTEARDLLAAARDIPADSAFWNNRVEGLAIFIAPGLLERYRLPLSFEEAVVVNRRFYVKPLLPMLTSADRGYILTLSQNRVRLFSATRHAIEEVEVPGLPANMEEALNYTGADRGEQVHSAMRGDLGKQAAVFHGHGGQADTHKDDLAGYFRVVSAAVNRVVGDEPAPVLLAGVEYLLPIYREVANQPRLAESALKGNCDYLSPHEIHEKAWPLVEPLLRKARDEAFGSYARMTGAGKTTNELARIVRAASQGKIDTLFVDVKAARWGRFDPDSSSIELHESPHEGDEELLDLAVVETLAHGGSVYSLADGGDIEADSAAAVLRY